MIDLGFKSECERLVKEKNERLDQLKIKMHTYLKSFIERNNVDSVELLEILSSFISTEINQVLAKQIEITAAAKLKSKNNILLPIN